MSLESEAPKIPLPRVWTTYVKAAVVHVMSLANVAGTGVRGKNAEPGGHEAEVERVNADCWLLREQLRILSARMERIDPRLRPNYSPTQRLAILEVRAARGWSLERTAREFFVTAQTIAYWTKRVREDGEDALVQVPVPVNRFPDFVRYSVQRLKTLCPALGKVKIAETLCRAGLHLGATTVGRILKGPSAVAPEPEPETEAGPKASVSGRSRSKTVVAAKAPNHVWHVDLTIVPTGGNWISWLPFAVPNWWPFSYWVCVVLDHFSRRVMGVAVFKKQPSSVQIRSFLGRTISQAGQTPKHLISDKGVQFWPCADYRKWCKRRGIKPRFGAIGQHGSIAVIERFFRTLKSEAIRRIFVPYCRESFRRELSFFQAWYNEARPHMTLNGCTPNEVYYRRRRKANQRPRLEPRKRWPRGSPCAKPRTLVAGQPGDRFSLHVDHFRGRRHLPVVTLRRAA